MAYCSNVCTPVPLHSFITRTPYIPTRPPWGPPPQARVFVRRISPIRGTGDVRGTISRTRRTAATAYPPLSRARPLFYTWSTWLAPPLPLPRVLLVPPRPPRAPARLSPRPQTPPSTCSSSDQHLPSPPPLLPVSQFSVVGFRHLLSPTCQYGDLRILRTFTFTEVPRL